MLRRHLEPPPSRPHGAPALLRPDLDALAERLTAAGHPVTGSDQEIPAMCRSTPTTHAATGWQFLAPVTAG
jgi:hypothetical protein